MCLELVKIFCEECVFSVLQHIQLQSMRISVPKKNFESVPSLWQTYLYSVDYFETTIPEVL